MESLGSFLKGGRQAAGLSLEDLAGRTRIRVENLRFLESEDLEALPTDPYVRGFVKLVCRELGLEPTDGLVRYETLRRDSGPPDEMTWAEEKTETQTRFLERVLEDPDHIVRWSVLTVKIAGLAIAGAAVVALLVMAVRWIDPMAPRSKVPIAFLPGEAPVVPDPEVLPVPPPVEKVEVPTPEVAVNASPPARDPEPAPVEKKPQTVVAQTPAPPPPVAAVTRDPPASRSELVGAPAAGGQLEMRVEALRAVEVTVLLDGAGYPRKKTLSPGETKSWKAGREFVLSASDGGAVRVFLQGEDLGLAGAAGDRVERLRVRPR